MKRRSNERRQALWWGLSALIVVSMLFSMVLMVSPAPAPRPTPTWLMPTATSRPTSTPPATPSPTPTPTLTPTPLPTAAVLSQDPSFAFVAVGDSRDGDAIFRQIIRQASSGQYAFMLHMGDLVHSGLEAEYKGLKAMLSELKVPLYAVPGNHDSPDGSLDLYLRYTGAPKAWYSFDYGQAHFALVDSHTGQVSSAQMVWLDADLAATRQPLKIVVVHHPPFDPNGSSHVMTGGNQAFMDLMERRGVSYVFAGHIHGYGREERNGVTYVVTGGGGAPLAAGQYYHYLKVWVRGQDLTYEVVRVK